MTSFSCIVPIAAEVAVVGLVHSVFFSTTTSLGTGVASSLVSLSLLEGESFAVCSGRPRSGSRPCSLEPLCGGSVGRIDRDKRRAKWEQDMG